MNVPPLQQRTPRRAPAEVTAPDYQPQPGDLLGRRFLIEGTLAHGPSGLLCRARTLDDGRPLAIRLMRATINDERARERFRRTTQAAMKLNCEHIARVVAAGYL